MTYLSLLTGHAFVFVLFWGVCFAFAVVWLAFLFVALSWPETHPHVAQADLCILCAHGGSTRAKKESLCPWQLHLSLVCAKAAWLA